MKRKAIMTVLSLLVATAAGAQAVHVYTGSVETVFAAPADQMPYSEQGAKLTVSSCTYDVSGIDSIVVDDSEVPETTIDITYSASGAHVVVAGNIAPYITATVSGAYVSIEQADGLAEEITYTLGGTSSDGAFYMDGSLKATIVLNGVSLTSTTGAPFHIANGKRIAVELADGTSNSFEDSASNEQKACFFVKGHTEFKGSGALTVKGNAKHAIAGNEYMEFKKSTGTITVTSAVKDGINVDQYIEVKGGTITVSGVGDDCIQVSKTDDDTDEQNGQIIVSGGTLSLEATATAAKGMKCEDTFTMTDGTAVITTSGGSEYDSDDSDLSGSAAIKADSDISISGGALTLKSTGKGGKGISSDANIVIDGGTFDITTTGAEYTYGQLSKLPKGIKAEGNLTIGGGTLAVTCSGGEGAEGMESKGTLTVNGGDIIANTYDDALNASSAIVINGGRTFACSTSNDAIDSNGTLTITGGLVLASGTREPEGGFDCDENTFAVTGGTIIGIGGATTTPTTSACTQPVVIVSGKRYSKGSYITLADSSGNNVFAFCVPQNYNNSGTLLISSPTMSVGSQSTIGYNASVSGGDDWQGYITGATISSSTTLLSQTLSKMVTTSSSSGPGGGGGRF